MLMANSSQAEHLTVTFFPNFAMILLVWSANGDSIAYFQGKFQVQFKK